MGTAQRRAQHLEPRKDAHGGIGERPGRSAPLLTSEGRRKLQERARRIEEEILPGLAEHGWSDDEDGTRRIDYALEAARLRALRSVLLEAESAPSLANPDRLTVGIGDLVVLRGTEGLDERYMIVHPVEADVDDVRISSASPLSRALLGRAPGETVEVGAPGGAYRCRLLRWEGSGAERHIVARVLRTGGATRGQRSDRSPR